MIYLGLAKNIFRNKFDRCSKVVLLGVTYRVLLTLALLLPFKILMIMGQSRVPEYFPSTLSELELDELIMLLSFLSVILYVVAQFTGSLYRSVKRNAAVTFMGDHSSPENDLELSAKTRKIYERVIEVTLDLSFFIFVFFIVLILFPAISIVMMIYSIGLLYFFMLAPSPRTRSTRLLFAEKSLSGENEGVTGGALADQADSLKLMIARFAELGFLITFLAIVAIYFFASLPNAIIVLGAFIALQRAISAMRSAMMNIIDLQLAKNAASVLTEIRNPKGLS